MAATIKTQQEEIEGLTERIIRIQSALEIALASRGARFGERDRRFRSIVTGRFGNVTDAGGGCCGCSNCSFSDRRQVMQCCLWKMGQGGAFFSVTGLACGDCVGIFGGRFPRVRAGRGFSQRFAAELDAMHAL